METFDPMLAQCTSLIKQMQADDFSFDISLVAPLDVVRASVVTYMHSKRYPHVFAEKAIEEFHTLYKNSTTNDNDETKSVYLKYLLAANLESSQVDQLLDQVKQTIANYEYNMRTALVACTQLPLFRFSEEKMFFILIHDQPQQKLTYFIMESWDPIKVFMQDVIGTMIESSLPLEQAIEEEFRHIVPRTYVSSVTPLQVQFMCHFDYRVALYEHARAWVTMYRGDYKPLESERETLKQIATFHVNHGHAVYLKADYGMRDLDLAPLDCLSLLQENVAPSHITQLNQKIEAMPNALSQMKVLITSLTFDEAAPKALNNSVLSVEDFKRLLSKKNQIALKLITPEVKEEKPTIVPELKEPPMQATANQTISETHIPTPEELAKVQLPPSLMNDTFSSTKSEWEKLPLAQSSSSVPFIRPANTLSSPVQSGVNLDLALKFGILYIVLALVLYHFRPRIITGPLNFFCGRKRRKSQSEEPLISSNDQHTKDIEQGGGLHANSETKLRLTTVIYKYN